MRAHTRRDFLKRLGMGAAAVALGGQGALAQARSGGRKPNVVLIFTDDQGSVDLNCYGTKDMYTPNLDKLAAQGTRFTQFYVGSPVCSPSRACLLTGRYPQRAGLDTNAGGERGLPNQQTTIAEMLKAEGYRTGIFGKWHLGMKPEMSPLSQGFDEFFGHKEGCIDNYSHFFYWHGPNRHDLWRNNEKHWEDGKYFPDLVVRETHRFLEANKDRPFFMYVPFNVPHYPLQAQEKYRAMYEGTEEPRASYAAFVATLDEKIGKVVDKIDALGLRENTIIIYLSDHGHSVEERTFYGGGSSGPYRGHKFTLWEGGIRVPCIVSWPGHIPERQVRDQMATSADWFPTIADYCNAKAPAHKLDGTSIAPLIASAGAASPHTTRHWQLGKHWAVRDGDWKLVVNAPATKLRDRRVPGEKLFLSNLAEDISETVNVADKHPDIVARLTKLHEAWVEEVRQQ
jgi:arylsulfatase A